MQIVPLAGRVWAALLRLDAQACHAMPTHTGPSKTDSTGMPCHACSHWPQQAIRPHHRLVGVAPTHHLHNGD